MSRRTVRLISFGAAVLLSPLCLFAGLGLWGRLMDASVQANREAGVQLLAVWFATLLPALLTYVPWGQLGQWLRGDGQQGP